MPKTVNLDESCARNSAAFGGPDGVQQGLLTPRLRRRGPRRYVADSDPAAGNLAPVDSSTPVFNRSSGSPELFDELRELGSAPRITQARLLHPLRTIPDIQITTCRRMVTSYPADSGYDASNARRSMRTNPPPPLPDYSQLKLPGTIITGRPAYWSYASGGYYWVPGAWVMVPWVNALWTPRTGATMAAATAGTEVIGDRTFGFYGGIDYGFGYTGRGITAAYWNHGTLNYNRAVTNVNVSVTMSTTIPVPNSGSRNRISYNGGRGGINARPTPRKWLSCATANSSC